MPAHPLLSRRDWLASRWERGDTVAAIADEADADLSTVHLWLQRHELPTRAHEIDRAVVQELLAHGHSAPEIARLLDVDGAVIYDRLLRWGLWTPASADGYDLDEITHWYVAREWPISRIADRLGVSRRTATRLLLAAGVQLRRPGRRKS